MDGKLTRGVVAFPAFSLQQQTLQNNKFYLFVRLGKQFKGTEIN